MNSREKGKRGERQWRDELRANGYAARRGQQFCGSPDSPDVVCPDLGWIHFEVKCVERLNIQDAMDQARSESAGKVPVVAHKRNHRAWLVTMSAEAFFQLLREGSGEGVRGNSPLRNSAGETSFSEGRVTTSPPTTPPGETRP